MILGPVPSLFAVAYVGCGIEFGSQSRVLADLRVQFSHGVQLGALGVFGAGVPVVGAVGLSRDAIIELDHGHVIEVRADWLCRAGPRVWRWA